MTRLAPLVFAAAMVVSTAMAAPDKVAVEREFQTWLTGDLWPQARAAGVSKATFDKAFEGVSLDWTLPELQPPGEPVKPPTIEWQAEFRSPAAYFTESGLNTLAKQGKSRLAQWRRTLDAIVKRYGVPADILVAIWGKESAYGTFRLPEPAIRVLATQAFMGRRGDLFRTQLLAALEILDRGDITADGMRSSWAGGLGQPQFLPSLYLRYAVDFDNDGRRDIWNSAPDTLASIANLLASEGWARGLGWGFEATVPPHVSCALEGPDQGKATAEWAAMGVRRADGTALPTDKNNRAFLLMPAGRFGPAFIVTQNFYVIKQYNNSDLYALYVGHLADRFSDNKPLAGAWKAVGKLTRGDIKALQDKLIAEGFDVGGADGLVGYKTRIAIGQWQGQHGLPQTCMPDNVTIAALL